MRNRHVLLALLLPVVGACADNSASDATATAATPAVASGAIPADAGAVGIADFTFTPGTINVPVGGSVVWTNNDTQQHTATSSGNFDAGAIQPGGSATVEFQTAGSFAYICSFHPFMRGTVVVG